MKQEHRVAIQVFRLSCRENPVRARRRANVNELDIAVVSVDENSECQGREAIAILTL